MSKWIWFDDVTQTFPHSEKKTCTWNVYSKENNPVHLGQVRWYAPWRQYVFYPSNATLYNAECLNDIATFCSENRSVRNKLV